MKNDKALVFLALIFVALFSYWTFNQIKYYRDKNKDGAFQNLPDTSSAFTENLGGEVDLNKPTDNNTSKGIVAGTTDNQPVGVPAWTANNYKQGDISKGNYTVKSGDTLWEIAEAVYGDGTQWVKILNANQSTISYLPNGQQSLIFPNQVLLIP